MSPRLLSFTAIFLSLTAIRAEEPAPSTAAEPAAPAKPYVLQRKSAFTALSEDERAPFWPIGWVKPKAGSTVKAATPAAPRVALDESAFKLTSILLGNPSLAIIDGRTYSEGEVLRQPRASGGGATVATSPVPVGARVRVHRIDDGSVTLQYQEEMIVVKIRRPEFAERRAEEQLILEDRP